MNCFLPRFDFEPLEPRYLLDGTIWEDAGVNEDHIDAAPVLTLPATIHRNASADNFQSGNEYYRLHVDPETVYEIHAFPHTTGNADAIYDVSICGQFMRVFDQEIITQWRFGADQDCSLSVYSNSQIDYTVQIRAIPDDSSAGLARAIAIKPGTIDGQLASTEQFDYYKFSGIAGSRYIFNANSQAYEGTRLYLRDSNGMLIGENGWGQMDSYLQTSGEYYLEIGSRSAGDYTLTMDAYIDDQANQPEPIGSSGIVNGTIENSWDSDYFTFDAQPGNVYLFYPVSKFDPALRLGLLSADGQSSPLQLELVTCCHTFSTSDFDSIAWIPSQAGSYQLSVSGEEADYTDPAGLGAYSIAVKSFALSAMPSDAPLLSAGNTSVAVGADAQNWFRFEAVKGGLYSFMTPENEPEGHFFQIFARDGTQLDDSYDAIYQYQTVGGLQWVAPYDGTFFLRAAHPDMGTYTLVMREQLDDQGGEAVGVTMPATVMGTIDYTARHERSDADLFRFTAKAWTTYTILPLHDDYLELKILDQNLNPVEEDWEDRIEATNSWTAPESGVYYLQVMRNAHRNGNRDTGPYSIYMGEAPQNDDDLPPLELHPNQSASGQIRFHGDSRRLSLIVPRSQTYRFTGSLPGYGRFDIKVLGAWGETDDAGHFSVDINLRGGKTTGWLDSDLPGDFQLSLAVLGENQNQSSEDDDSGDATDPQSDENSSTDSTSDEQDDSSTENGTDAIDWMYADNSESEDDLDAVDVSSDYFSEGDDILTGDQAQPWE